ncbi:MAG: class I SAM-dependent methyltransferase [Gammaproteobacteria bacterium]|nr:class I SAM-dependent methyltransferase [Gammaproteobacteria bacterium]
MNKFSYNSTQYTDYRPNYPKELYAYLQKCAGNGLVVDCGAGSGQNSLGLSQYFKTVIATDLSFELLLKASHLKNVSYVQSSADQLPIRSNTTRLICIAQAIHWFPLNDFYREVKRILQPDGIIAAWGYNQAVIEPKVDEVIKKIYLQMSSAQNPSAERQYLYDHYKTLPFPFQLISSPDFSMQVDWNLHQLIGYIKTWPGLLEYEKRFGVNLVDEREGELFAAWEDPSNLKLVTWPIYLKIGVI